MKGVRFRAWGAGFRVQGSGFRVQGLKNRAYVGTPVRKESGAV